MNFNYSERAYGIEIIYSGFIDSADDVIMRYIESYNHQEDLLIISSDRQIVDLAESRRIDILKSEEFYHLIQASESGLQILKSSGLNRPNKITSDTNQELDDLMEAASRQIKSKDESHSKLRKSNARKLSKGELQKKRKLKKL